MNEMSMCFEIFPTTQKKPNCDEIIKCSIDLFSDFLRKENISHEIDVTAIELTDNNKIYNNPISLVLKEDYHMVFNLNGNGQVYMFYHELTDLDKEFWAEEIQINKRAQSIKDKIGANLEIGYYWSVKRTMGQPAIVSLYYGYLAIAIAILTDGIIYSDDGAWDYSKLPIMGEELKTEYLNIKSISDTSVKDNVEKWLDELKTEFCS